MAIGGCIFVDFNIVTFHTATNYGAVLQTFALQEFITKLGYEAGVFDYRPNNKVNSRDIKTRLIHIAQRKNQKEERIKEAKFRNFENQYLHKNGSKESRVFIAGSDQVWNATGPMDSTYFLRFVGDNSVRASYAASMRKAIIPKDRIDFFKEYINRFDAFSVREEDVKNLISEYVDEQISVNVDPTLLLDSKFWTSYAKKPTVSLPDQYILAYILHKPNNINLLIDWLQKETGIKVVLLDSQGVLSYFVKNDLSLLNIGPEEFLWLFANANAVVTSSFHGTAFSIIFQKEFYSIVNSAAPSRITNILDLLGINAISDDQTSFVRNDSINWALVNSILDKERKRSKIYIDDVYALYEKKKNYRSEGTVETFVDRCTGCATCEAVCPTKAITMKMNEQGFYEPVVSHEKCFHCGKCINECPLKKKQGILRVATYYGKHKDKSVVLSSSSGGAFRGLAETVLAEGGMVFGAVYSPDNKEVLFSDTDRCDLKELQRSKYTVSNPSGIYIKIKEKLDSGRKVLFCGTPCQCAGLTSFLSKEYDNLIRCDFLCGGMASLKFYQEHLVTLEKKYESKIVSINFRPKKKGWGKHYLSVFFENGKELFVRDFCDAYFNCFVEEHVSVRKTCLDCEFRVFHVSDITLADFWGYKAAGVKKDKEGLSLIVANTNRGKEVIEKSTNLDIKQIDNSYSTYGFSGKIANVKKVRQQEQFFETVKELGFERTAEKLYPASMSNHAKKYVSSHLLKGRINGKK